MREFRRAVAALKRNPSVDALEAEATTWRIRDIVEEAIAGAGRDTAATVTALYEVKACYEQECARRLTCLEDREVLSLHRRRADYPEIYRGLNAIDDPDDIEVVLDAHDLALCVPGLVLWTGDGAHIVRNREQILGLTGLTDLRFLGDVGSPE